MSAAGPAGLRVVFMGSPAFAVPTLEALRAVEEVVLVVTQPDKPRGRGRQVAPPEVKVAAEAAGIPVAQPRTLRVPEAVAALAAARPDVIVVVAYGKILPPDVLALPRLGCLNVHASILPRYRGAAPIQWAILRGETETGVCVMQMEAGLDTGPVYDCRRVAIGEEETGGSLHDRLAPIGAALLVEVLARIKAGTAGAPAPQDDACATLAPMLRKEDGVVRWERSARAIRDQVRALDPWPGAQTLLAGEALRLFRPRLVDGSGAPGEVLGLREGALAVVAGEGAVAFEELQLPGRRRMPAAELLRGRPVPPGTRLSTPEG